MDKKKKILLCFGCDFSGRYNFRKIIKIVATGCHIIKLKCTKFDFGWDSVPDPSAGAYGAPPDPLAGFKGPTSKEKEGKGGEGKGLRGGKERDR